MGTMVTVVDDDYDDDDGDEAECLWDDFFCANNKLSKILNQKLRTYLGL